MTFIILDVPSPQTHSQQRSIIFSFFVNENIFTICFVIQNKVNKKTAHSSYFIRIDYSIFYIVYEAVIRGKHKR